MNVMEREVEDQGDIRGRNQMQHVENECACVSCYKALWTCYNTSYTFNVLGAINHYINKPGP